MSSTDTFSYRVSFTKSYVTDGWSVALNGVLVGARVRKNWAVGGWICENIFEGTTIESRSGKTRKDAANKFLFANNLVTY